MNARIRIDVKNRKEAENIRRGLALPDVRAFVITCGILDTLPSKRAQARVLNFVVDHFNEFPPQHVNEERDL
jgi:hypothetical protein